MYERKDALYRRAKQEGYRSRAAYKLLELQPRVRLLRPGDAVVDLGAWPGGWLQVAAALVGTRGRVLGIDAVAVDPLPAAPQVETMTADVGDPDLPARVLARLGRPADVVLSDLAPKLSGVRPRDAALAGELQGHAHRLATAVLRPGGALVMKTFGGAGTEAVRRALQADFAAVRLLGLAATRKGSSELYLVATRRRGGPTGAAPAAGG